MCLDCSSSSSMHARISSGWCCCCCYYCVNMPLLRVRVSIECNYISRGVHTVSVDYM